MFIIISLAILKLVAIASVGFFLYKKAYINQNRLNFLSYFLINLTIPFLIFSRLTSGFTPFFHPGPGIFILLSIGIFLSGFFLGYIFSYKRAHTFKGEFVSLVSFQNSGYLPMSLAFVLLPQNLCSQFLVYTFLYLLGFDILMWSVGTFFIFKKPLEKFNIYSLLTAPIISIIVSLFLVYTKTISFVPGFIKMPIAKIGETSFILSMVVMGCWLARISKDNLKQKILIAGEVALLKLIALPFLILMVLINFKIFSLLGLFIMIQVSMPSAVSLPIVMQIRQADSEFTSQGVLLTHLLSIITVPFWLSLYLRISGFTF